MSIQPDYNNLHFETLEVILKMHVKQHAQLVKDPLVGYSKIANLYNTILQVRSAMLTKTI